MRNLLTRSAATAVRVFHQRRRDSWKDCRGFTLVELLVSIGILSVILGTVGTAIFTALASEGRIVDDGIAVNELRKGLGWFAEDVKQAQTVALLTPDPISCPAADTYLLVTLTRDDFDLVPDDETPPDRHVITYQQVDDKVQRTVQNLTYEAGGAVATDVSDSHPIARRVTAACFSSLNNNVTATITVEAGPHGETRDLSVVSLMRLPN